MRGGERDDSRASELVKYWVNAGQILVAGAGSATTAVPGMARRMQAAGSAKGFHRKNFHEGALRRLRSRGAVARRPFSTPLFDAFDGALLYDGLASLFCPMHTGWAAFPAQYTTRTRWPSRVRARCTHTRWRNRHLNFKAIREGDMQNN
jgi:hypothetical protein